jgi:hypothetical protein
MMSMTEKNAHPYTTEGLRAYCQEQALAESSPEPTITLYAICTTTENSSAFLVGVLVGDEISLDDSGWRVELHWELVKAQKLALFQFNARLNSDGSAISLIIEMQVTARSAYLFSNSRREDPNITGTIVEVHQ